MNETFEQLTARHSREVLDFIRDCEAKAYCSGVDNSPHIGAGSGPHSEMRAIADKSARLWGVSLEEIRGASRYAKYCMPRHEAFYHAHHAGFSLSEIGRYFGGRDRTTVINGIKRHESRMERWQ